MSDQSPVAKLEREIEHIWWMPFLEGLLAIAFGALAVFWPGLTLVTLVILVSVFFIVWGIIETIDGLLNIKDSIVWWIQVLFGVISLGIGLYFARHFHASLRLFIFLVGLVLIARGIIDIAGSVMLKKLFAMHRVLYTILGALAIVAGIFILLQPTTGGIAFVWILGLFSILFGIVMMVIAAEMHNYINKLKSHFTNK
jgi:uncharacterized membrane protein HdeD (DUF308 family)